MFKDFSDEFLKFKNKIYNNEPFSLVRFFDGEWFILSDKFEDLTDKCNGEWKYDPSDSTYRASRQKLIDSLQYKSNNYYVGIMTDCPCLKSYKHGGQKLMIDMANQREENLTFASVFFYSNYCRFLNEMLSHMKSYKTVLVVNHKANISSIPLNIKKVFRVGTDAWINDINIIDELENYVKYDDEKYLFVICAGPLSNIIIHKLHQINSNNTYINFGSVLDELMFDEPTRWYQCQLHLRSHDCIW